MKIAYITRARMPTEKAHGLQIAKMCEAYALLGHNVELVVPYRKNTIREDVHAYYGLKKSFPVRTITILDTIVFSRWFPRIAFWFQSVLFLLKLCTHSFPLDTIIMTRSVDVAWWYGRKGYTVVCEVHDIPKSYLGVFRFFLKYASLIVCNSKGTAQKVSDLGLKNVVSLPNGVDIEALTPRVSKYDMRKKLGIPHDAFVLLYAGALEEWKGYRTVLSASEKLESVITVILGGKPNQVSELKNKYPNVLFLGTTPYRELGDYQNMADVLVVPNDPHFVHDQENTSPIKLFAHLASTVPVVVTDLPSLRDIVSEEEVFFFDGSAQSLVQKVEEMRTLKAEVSRKVENARKEASKHSWTSRAEEIIQQTLNIRNT
jgi:glycosyltransferase involved in cell wall biosynthesis